MQETPPQQKTSWKIFQACFKVWGREYPHLYLELVIASRVCNYTVRILNLFIVIFSLEWSSFKANRVCYHLPWLFPQILSFPCQVINPVDLTYQTRTYQQKRSNKPNVAPRSSICRHSDPFYQLDLDPRDFTANTVVLSQYLSEMGKIQSRAYTSLTAKNQRLLGKTIRRAKMMGIIPHLSILPSVEKRLRRR